MGKISWDQRKRDKTTWLNPIQFLVLGLFGSLTALPNCIFLFSFNFFFFFQETHASAHMCEILQDDLKKAEVQLNHLVGPDGIKFYELQLKREKAAAKALLYKGLLAIKNEYKDSSSLPPSPDLEEQIERAQDNLDKLEKVQMMDDLLGDLGGDRLNFKNLKEQNLSGPQMIKKILETCKSLEVGGATPKISSNHLCLKIQTEGDKFGPDSDLGKTLQGFFTLYKKGKLSEEEEQDLKVDFLSDLPVKEKRNEHYNHIRAYQSSLEDLKDCLEDTPNDCQGLRREVENLKRDQKIHQENLRDAEIRKRLALQMDNLEANVMKKRGEAGVAFQELEVLSREWVQREKEAENDLKYEELFSLLSENCPAKEVDLIEGKCGKNDSRWNFRNDKKKEEEVIRQRDQIQKDIRVNVAYQKVMENPHCQTAAREETDKASFAKCVDEYQGKFLYGPQSFMDKKTLEESFQEAMKNIRQEKEKEKEKELKGEIGEMKGNKIPTESFLDLYHYLRKATNEGDFRCEGIEALSEEADQNQKMVECLKDHYAEGALENKLSVANDELRHLDQELKNFQNFRPAPKAVEGESKFKKAMRTFKESFHSPMPDYHKLVKTIKRLKDLVEKYRCPTLISYGRTTTCGGLPPAGTAPYTFLSGFANDNASITKKMSPTKNLETLCDKFYDRQYAPETCEEHDRKMERKKADQERLKQLNNNSWTNALVGGFVMSAFPMMNALRSHWMFNTQLKYYTWMAMNQVHYQRSAYQANQFYFRPR